MFFVLVLCTGEISTQTFLRGKHNDFIFFSCTGGQHITRPNNCTLYPRRTGALRASRDAMLRVSKIASHRRSRLIDYRVSKITSQRSRLKDYRISETRGYQRREASRLYPTVRENE